MQFERDEMNSCTDTLVNNLTLEDSGQRLCAASVCSIYTAVKKKSISSDLILLVSKRHASKVPPRRYSIQHASDLSNLVKHPQLKNKQNVVHGCTRFGQSDVSLVGW